MGIEEVVKANVPPHNLEAEESVLGAMLLSRDAIAQVIEILDSRSFYRRAHRDIYEAIIELFESGEPVDIISVSDHLSKKGLLESVGGYTYLSSLLNKIPTPSNAAYHAKIVQEKAILRELIEAGIKIKELAEEESDEVPVIMDKAEQLIFAVTQRKVFQYFIPLKEELFNVFELIEVRSRKHSYLSGIPTGFEEFDKLTGGLQYSDFIVIAGRPSMGKTAFCLNIAHHVGVNLKLPVAVFSLEMSSEQVAMRMLSSEAGIPYYKLRVGDLSETEWRRITTGINALAEAPIYIDDSPNISVLEMRAKARRLKSEVGLSLIIIDYLQLMSSGARMENRVQEISKISRDLKAMARELNVPVVTLSQLSRAVEQRQDKRPQLSDLRESGAIEQEADLVLFLYREEYYNKETPQKGTCEVIVAKHRNGPTGTIKLGFNKEIMRFEDLRGGLVQ
ncbi:MAG: replicative DNA helicase [bacterium]|nr:replicative DNA helicase [bacterium]